MNIKIMLKSWVIVVAIILLSTHVGQAQKFSASVLLGSNFAQIDGDDLAGFNKLGFTAGLLTEYPLTKSRTLSIELLYNQTGSKSALTFGKAPGVEFIALSYIDIPILFRINDWEIEETYYKVFAEGGLSFGRLFNTEVANSFFTGLDNDFTKNRIAFALGAGFRFNNRLGITGRYTRSINSLYKNERLLARSLFGYFLTFRLEYKL